jgi:hypothetical protein
MYSGSWLNTKMEVLVEGKAMEFLKGEALLCYLVTYRVRGCADVDITREMD